MKILKYTSTLLFAICGYLSYSQDHSVAREWNELNLFALQKNFNKPTLKARDLWHVSAGMYDAWAAFSPVSEPYFLGNTVGEYLTPYTGISVPTSEDEIIANQEEAISYAAYRIMSHRFENLPGTNEIEVLAALDALMLDLGYDIEFTSTDYANGGPAALGNYIAENVIAFGLQDGSFQEDGYDNQFYQPQNEELVTQFDGNPDMTNPNRWQPLTLIIAIDASGNPLPINTPKFLSAEWGQVVPFALSEEDRTIFERDEGIYPVYLDPGMPHLLDTETEESGLDDPYKKDFILPAIFSSLHDPSDGEMMDISPSSIGNQAEVTDSENFYNFFEGTDSSLGHTINPYTGSAYEPQVIPRADYNRVIASFWSSDHGNSAPETWFMILNMVNDHPDNEKRWQGEGVPLSDLDWDIKSYFTLGGTLHDCAIAAWGAKGWYDYPRPISAIRYMGDQGQSSDNSLPNYSTSGLPLIPNYVELVSADDPLVGENDEHLNKLKIKSWRGKDYLDQKNLIGQVIDGVQDSTLAGVGWILSEDWWPYQDYLITSPPHGSYVSGVSAFSHGAAETLSAITGNDYFPGGLGSISIEMNNYLTFEQGPSVPMELQWATYKDAAHQAGISRIHAGVQTGNGVFNGLMVGSQIGDNVMEFVDNYLSPIVPEGTAHTVNTSLINDEFAGSDLIITITYDTSMNQEITPALNFSEELSQTLFLSSGVWISNTEFQWTFTTQDSNETFPEIQGTISGAENQDGITQLTYNVDDLFSIDTENPIILNDLFSNSLINDQSTGSQFTVDVLFSETMDQTNDPILAFTPEPLNSLTENGNSQWLSAEEFQFVYEVSDEEEEIIPSAIYSGAKDLAGNLIQDYTSPQEILIDNRNPQVIITANTYDITEANTGENGFQLFVIFDENMDFSVTPNITFPEEDPSSSITLSEEEWLENSYIMTFDVNEELSPLAYIDLNLANATDSHGNMLSEVNLVDYFSILLDTYLTTGDLELNELRVYPNPIKRGESVSIVHENLKDYEISLYDIRGKKLRSNSDLNSTNKALLRTENLASGNYFVKLSSSKSQKVYRIQVID